MRWSKLAKRASERTESDSGATRNQTNDASLSWKALSFHEKDSSISPRLPWISAMLLGETYSRPISAIG